MVICTWSAYLHTGPRHDKAALRGLTHDRTRSSPAPFKDLLHRRGHPHMTIREPAIEPNKQKAINVCQSRPLWHPPAPHIDLVPQDLILSLQLSSRLKERSQTSKNQLEQVGHKTPILAVRSTRRRRIAFSAHTAYPDEVARARALNDGIICYLRKPLDTDDLVHCLRSALERGRPPESTS